MTIYNGLIASLVFNGNDISEDIETLSISAGGAPIDVSALDLVGFQRIIGRVDASLQITARVSSVATGAHATLKGASAGAISGSCVITTTAGPVFTFHGIVGAPSWAIDKSLGLIINATISMDTGVAGAWT